MMDHQKGFSISTRNHLMFKGWDLNSYQGLVAALLTTVVLSIILEFTNSFTKIVAESKKNDQDGTRSLSFKEKLVLNTKLSLLQMTRVFIAYVLMLCVMTMNLWIYIATMAGAGIGYFFSGFLNRKPTHSDIKTPNSGTNTSGDKCESKLLSEETKDITEEACTHGHASDPLLHTGDTEDPNDTIL